MLNKYDYRKHIAGMPKVEKLSALVGAYVNLAYPLPNGTKVKFLNDQTTYLGYQLELACNSQRNSMDSIKL